MDAAAAIRTLELLAEGRDPETGRTLPERSPLNQPAVVRSLYAAIRALDSASKQSAVVPPMPLGAVKPSKAARAVAAPAEMAVAETANRVHPANAGKPWTAQEDAALCDEFDQGMPIRELAARHGRSTTALNARLFKLGKIADPGIPLRHPVTSPQALTGGAGKPAPRARPSATPAAA